jgi:hypothetical protein
MRPFHLLLITGDGAEPRRVDFQADDPFQAFQSALNERSRCEVELWDGERLLVRMSKTEANLWKLHGMPPAPPEAASRPDPSGAAAA